VDLSVVIPLFNEEENADLLYRELSTVLRGMNISYEIVIVDDGSRDKGLEILRNVQAVDSHLVLVSFRKNFGQTAAMAAGFDHAEGDVIVTMDADLQNDPADIPKVLEKMKEGYDVVAGWRHDRQDPYLSRILPSRIANKIISTATGVRLHDYGCTLKAFRKEVVKEISLYGEMHRFIPAIASGMGISIAEVRVNHRPRRFGSSKYGISRTIRVILDLLTVKFLLNYATRPIHVFGSIGMLSGGVGFILTCIMVLQRQFWGVPMGDRPLFLLSILLMFIGVQFVTGGLLAELLARTYHEAQGKPIYYIKEIFKKS